MARRIVGNKIEQDEPPQVFDKFFSEKERDRLQDRKTKMISQQSRFGSEISRLSIEIADWTQLINQLP